MAKIRIANAPCSWGVLEWELEGEAASMEQVLNEIKETGYEGSELGDWDFMPTDPSELRRELDMRSLDMVAAFVPVALKDASNHKAGAELAVKTAKLMADAGYKNAFIVLADENGTIDERTQNAGKVTSAMGLSEQEWEVYAQGANYVASQVKEHTNLRTVFHHHCAGYVETPYEIEKFMSMTDPKLVGLVLDMGHYMFGGGDPLTALKTYSDRIHHIHFKDCNRAIAEESLSKDFDYFQCVNAGVFCKLGDGSVDFKAIADQLKATDYNGWIVVEQDVLPGMGDPKACAQHNRDFIKTLGL